MTVEFHVGAGEPPIVPHSIYSDLINLPDPVKLGLTVRIFNYDGVGLYMRVDGYAAGWSFTTNDLGLLASGSNIYRNLDQFGSRAKPAAELTETITVRLRAYTDAGYSNLKWTYERVIDIVFIKSDDGSWTTDYYNNFDDGTVQGWAALSEALDGPATLSVVTDYVLSTPYSLKVNEPAPTGGEHRTRLYKTINTPNRNKVYAIIDTRIYYLLNYAYPKYIQIQNGSTVLLFVGRPYDTSAAAYIPTLRWLRIVVPLPKNTAVDLRIVLDFYMSGNYSSRQWMDDFKVISKD